DQEHEADQAQEKENVDGDYLRRKADGWRERVHRSVPNDAVDVPMLAEARANVAHEPHEPGKSDRDEDQDVLGDHRHPAPLYFARLLRPAEEEDVDSRDGHHGEKNRDD